MAKAFGVHARTVRRWALGQSRFPPRNPPDIWGDLAPIIARHTRDLGKTGERALGRYIIEAQKRRIAGKRCPRGYHFFFGPAALIAELERFEVEIDSLVAAILAPNLNITAEARVRGMLCTIVANGLRRFDF